MSERAALYTVAVRPRRRQGPLPLGDIDGAGTSLADVLAGILDGFAETSADGAARRRWPRRRRATATTCSRSSSTARAASPPTSSTPSGGVRLRQTPDDLQLVRCGCLFRLPGRRDRGDARRPGLERARRQGPLRAGAELRASARAFPGLALAIEPARRARRAPRRGRRRTGSRRCGSCGSSRPGAARSPTPASGSPRGEPARLELDVAVPAAGARIEPALLERYLDGDGSALRRDRRASAGSTFDQARVGVAARRTARAGSFDLAHPDGRAARSTRELAGIVLDAAGEPTDASLLAALARRAVARTAAYARRVEPLNVCDYERLAAERLEPGALRLLRRRRRTTS